LGEVDACREVGSSVGPDSRRSKAEILCQSWAFFQSIRPWARVHAAIRPRFLGSGRSGGWMHATLL